MIKMNEIDNKHIFMYVMILIFVVYYTSNLKIKLNVIFGIGVGILCIWLLNNNDNNNNNKKIDLIIPQPRYEKKETIDYLFSIQEFYEINPQTYEDIIENMDIFFDRYYETEKDNSLAGVNYKIMIDQKSYIEELLQSMIYKFPSNKEYTEKLKKSVKNIKLILDEYIEKIIVINNKYKYYNGINNRTIFIDNSKIKSINMYEM